MARARKLFPIYGSALANNVFVALVRGRVIENFVAGYVTAYDRRGILGGPARDRELAETIGREVVLAVLLEVRAALPRFFGKRLSASLKEKEAIEAFLRELISALDRRWDWNVEDQLQFQRDLSLYEDFAAGHKGPVASNRKGKKLREEDPPFVGRVALLLDPSMLEQARRAARKFHGDAGRFAQKLLKQTLRPSR